MTGIQGDINIIFSSVAAITLLGYCSCYLEGIWTHLAYLINLKVAGRDRGSSSHHGINWSQAGPPRMAMWYVNVQFWCCLVSAGPIFHSPEPPQGQ